MPGRHFFGHGVFTADGGRLYATENDYAAGRGVIGIYDVRDDFRRIGEWDSGGVGPHELVWTADGRSLAIANGGLDTTPDAGGRIDLNKADMEASLVLVDADGGGLLARHRLGPDLAQLSMRHLAVDATGAVWFGCQHFGDPTALPPLAGRLVPGRDPNSSLCRRRSRRAPRTTSARWPSRRTAARRCFSAPKGNFVFAFAAGSGEFVGSVDVADGCGLAPVPGGEAAVLVTAGTARWSAGGPRRISRQPTSDGQGGLRQSSGEAGVGQAGCR